MGRRDKAPAVVVEEKPEEEEEEEEAAENSSAPESTGESEEEPAETSPTKTKKPKKAKPAKESESGDEEAAKKKKKKKHRSKAEANHPPTTEMVLEALMALDEKKGTSIKAIKDYITTENTVRPELLSNLMRKALPKLLAKESIIRPKGEESKSLMMGRYKVAPRKTEKTAVRERPASLRKLADPNAALKKKKKKRKAYY